METKPAGEVNVRKSTMEDEEFAALKKTAKYVDKMLIAMDRQNNPNYPYLNATSVDLCRMIGRELISREEDAVNLGSK